MCLLCPRHHTAVHARIWQITMVNVQLLRGL
jgi:hypothetical protein